jgi:tetratricopeptide (TPR) repeat protein
MEELLPAAREGGDIQAYRPALTTAAFVAVDQGHPQTAAALLDELENDLEGGGYNRAYGMLEGTLVARALGDADRAERIARVEEPFVPGYPLGKALMLASQAEVAEAQGRYAQALEAFDRAEKVWEGLGHVFHRGLAWLGTARCLAALKRPGEASEPAEAAERVFLSLGALSMAGEAGALVRDASSASS